MANNTANKILCEEEDEETTSPQNTFQDTIKEMGGIVFEKYPKHNTNLSHENVTGLIMAESLNDYMSTNFRYRYNVIDKLISEKQVRVMGVSGFGLDKIIEFVKSIQASFEQTQLPNTMNNLLGRNR
jgi:hypothetical protein